MPKYLVDLNPLGIRYQEETTASSPNQAVQNMLYRYLSSIGKPGELPLLTNDLKKRSGERWDQRVRECAIEVYENPDMAVQAFQKVVNKEHPGAVIADAWKIHHKMKFTDFDKLADIIGEKEALFSVKLDGELNAICYDGTSVQLVTPRGTVRTNMPPTKEAAQLLAKHKSAVFLGELYAVDEGGKPQSYMKASSLLKDPKGGGDNLLRLSVFDVHSIDGTEYESLSIEERTKMIGDIFGKGQTVQPALSVHGTVDKADELWSQLETKGWEGLVVYFGADMYKAKPIQTYDMVIIAVNKSKFIEQTSAVLCAFMDDQGRFRLTGAISGGFSDEERIRLMEWAERNKAMEDDERIWVDPFAEPLVVEIEAIEVTERPRPTYEFKGGKWNKLQDSLGGSLRFPQFIRMRDDKKPTPQDTSIDQVVQEASVVYDGGEFPEEYQIREGELDAMKRWVGDDPTPLDKYYIQALLDYYNRVPFKVFMHYVQTVSKVPGKEGFAMDAQTVARSVDSLQFLLGTPKYQASMIVTADELWGNPTVSIPGQSEDLGAQVTKKDIDFILGAYASNKFSLQELQTKIRAVLGRDVAIEDIDAFISSLSEVDVTVGEDKVAEGDWAAIVHKSPYGQPIEASLGVQGFIWNRYVVSPDGKLSDRIPERQNHVQFLWEVYAIDYDDALNTGWSAISHIPLHELSVVVGTGQDMEQVLMHLPPEMLDVSLLAFADGPHGGKIGVDYDLGEDALSAYKKRGKTAGWGDDPASVRASKTKNLSGQLESGIIEVDKQRSPRNDEA